MTCNNTKIFSFYLKNFVFLLYLMYIFICVIQYDNFEEIYVMLNWKNLSLFSTIILTLDSNGPSLLTFCYSLFTRFCNLSKWPAAAVNCMDTSKSIADKEMHRSLMMTHLIANSNGSGGHQYYTLALACSKKKLFSKMN